ncbi:hypothetical protein E2320_006728 [Naja naja]|nr:hypothetical protein E2320_006728 [Naja naja]
MRRRQNFFDSVAHPAEWRTEEPGGGMPEEESGPCGAALPSPAAASLGDSGETPGGSGAAGGMSPVGPRERWLPGGRCRGNDASEDPEMKYFPSFND